MIRPWVPRNDAAARPPWRPRPLRAERRDVAIGHVEAGDAGAGIQARATEGALQRDPAGIVLPFAACAGEGDGRQEEAVLVALQRRKRRVEDAQAVVDAPSAIYVQVALPQRRRAADVAGPVADAVETVAGAVEERGIQRQRAPGRRFPETADRDALLVVGVVAALVAADDRFGVVGARRAARCRLPPSSSGGRSCNCCGAMMRSW